MSKQVATIENNSYVSTDTDLAYVVREEIEHLNRAVNASFLALAERLHAVSNNNWYVLYDYETFDEFIESIDMSRAWAYELIKLHKTYVIGLGVGSDRLVEIGVTKLTALSRDITKDNADHLLDIADGASVSDLKREMGRLPEVGTGSNRSIIEPGYYHIMPADSINAVGDTLGRRSVEVIETDVGMVIKVG